MAACMSIKSVSVIANKAHVGIGFQRPIALPRLAPAPAAQSDELSGNPLLSAQFMGVLQQSLARQGAEALTKGPPPEERVTAAEEVLTAGLQQSKQTLAMLNQWRLQIDAQIAAQEKQVTRMEFALNKVKNDAAYMKALKSMVYDSSEE